MSAGAAGGQQREGRALSDTFLHERGRTFSTALSTAHPDCDAL
jgi:hypothetical protein